MPAWRRSAVRLMALGVVAVAALTLAGHTVRSRLLYAWLIDPGMAVNTAFCLFLVGLCFLVLIGKDAE